MKTEEKLNVMPLSNFKVSREILLLEPKLCRNLKYTLVHELNRTYLIKAYIPRVIEKICNSYGSSLKTALNLKRSSTPGIKKLPISVGSTNPLILIPTASHTKTYVRWVNYHAIISYEDGGYGYCKALLQNGRVYPLNLSLTSLRTQMSHAQQIDRYMQSLSNNELMKLFPKDDPFIGTKNVDELEDLF